MSADLELLFDNQALNTARELEARGESNLVALLINNFKQEAPQLMASLHANLFAGQIQEAERHAHTLASSSRLMGAMRLGSLLASIEDHIRDKNLEPVGDLMAQAESVLNQTIPLIMEAKNATQVDA